MSEIRVDNITDEAGTGRPDFTNGIQTSNINGGQVGGRRNLLINGGFDVWQRGLNFPDSGYTADRWFFGQNTASGTAERVVLNSTEVTEIGASNSIKININSSPTSLPATLIQRVEDVRMLAGKTVTISFLTQGNLSGTEGIFINQNFGSGGSSSVNTAVSSWSITSGENVYSGWYRHEHTVTIPGIGGKTVSTVESTSFTELQIYLPGSTGEVYFTNIQLEVGDSATDFEIRPYGDEYLLCARYFQRVVLRNGATADDDYNVNYTGCDLRETMRADPSINITSVNAEGHHNNSPDRIDIKNHSIGFQWSGSSYRTIGMRVRMEFTLDAEI